MAELTPMMQQYLQIKEQNQDAILFFRLGDFYEMFGADAKTASRELDLTLTTRDKSKDKPAEERMPMCGVPYHSADSYIARLIAKGYKVAICEQTEDPAQAKALQFLRRYLSGRGLRRSVRLRHHHRQGPRHRLFRPGTGEAAYQRAGPLFPRRGGGERSRLL